MKYLVIGTYKITENVDTESVFFKDFVKRESCFDWHKNRTEKDWVEDYAQKMAGYDIIDDDGHGTLTPSSFDWVVKEEK